jgi:hypothetical protein
VFGHSQPASFENATSRRQQDMKKTIAALVAVTTIAASLVSVTPPAQAGDGNVAAGVAAGLIGGALVGGAIASSRPAYGGPVYVAEPPPPAYGGCYWRRQRYWDGYGWVVRPVRVCY